MCGKVGRQPIDRARLAQVQIDRASVSQLGRQCIEYANAATFSPDSKRIAIASWSKGEIWHVDAFPKVRTD